MLFLFVRKMRVLVMQIVMRINHDLHLVRFSASNALDYSISEYILTYFPVGTIATLTDE